MNRKDYIDFAHRLGWTKKDAERAYGRTKDSAPETEVEVLRTLALFAGRELAERQRLQAAQKGQATRNRNAREQLEVKVVDMAETYETQLEEERSFWRGALARVYRQLQKRGITIDFIEELLNRRAG